MDVYPAIDLLKGRPVRLRQGRFDEVSRFGDDPVALARNFATGGASWLHVVDLDGARDGGWHHLALIAAMASAVPLSVQAGGGVRTSADIEAALERGVSRVIVGTAAADSPPTFTQWARRFGDHLVVSLDTRDCHVARRGWTEDSTASLSALAEVLCAAGARRFIHTSIARDGTLEGVDLSGLRDLQRLGRPVIVAGGIASYADLVSARDAGAEGAIVGRALLDGTLEIGQALRVASETRA